ncbi:MAG: hypothetical protein R3240_11685, partial [Gammaproteobacteria bacterium]|nr:hypothetical protein [Gammaproteobacteria bacterium]
TVADSSDVINCGANCSTNLDAGTQVTLTATPTMGYEFSSWGGDCSSSQSNTCALTMNQAHSVIANFTQLPPSPPPTAFDLTVSVNDTSLGKVVSKPRGIRCGRDCTETYAANTVVILRAKKAQNHRFLGWSGACSGRKKRCIITMDQAQSVSATFR